MRFKATGQVLHTAAGYCVRVRISGPNDRPTFALAVTSNAAAAERAALLADLAGKLRRVAARDEIFILLEEAGNARTKADLAEVQTAAAAILNGETAKASSALAPTFEDFAEDWTSGKLRRDHPDHVRDKDSTRDEEILRLYINRHEGPTRLPDFTIEHAERVMAALPAKLAPRSRKKIAQCMSKVLSLAVYPGRHIVSNPIPREWMPKIPKSANKAKACLYPDEEAKLTVCAAVPLERRLAYGILAREGMRASELELLRWHDVDLARGRVRLDENKTDDPRAWALSPDVVRVLTWWRKRTDRGDDTDLVLGVRLGDGAWLLRGDAHYDASKPDTTTNRRGDLRTAGVTRRELFERTASRQPLRLHDFRALFVTVSLANGKTEQWVTDRTGHKSSQQVATYTRQARTWAELELGALRPLDELLPEMAGKPRTAPVEAAAPPPLPSPAAVIGRRLDGDESPLGDLNPRPALYESAALPLS